MSESLIEEARHEKAELRYRSPRRRRFALLLSRSPNAVGAIHPKPTSSAASKSCMATKSYSRSSAETTRVPAAAEIAFKRCCLATGKFDGALRNDYF